MMRPTPGANSIHAHVLKDIEPIPNTNDLWLAQATRAVKNPGKGEYMLVLIRPQSKIEVHPAGVVAGSVLHGHRITEGYTRAGFVKPYDMGYKIAVHSPVGDDPTKVWVAQQRGVLYADDYATARRLLIVLARELVLDRS